MNASDVEKDDSVHTGDRSNVTTDDEFFNELMDAPAEFEDCLIPDHCQNEVVAIEHLTQCLNRRFAAYPVVFMGSLKDALKEAFGSKKITERRPFLIYINNDKSLYTNLFCKQLLCNDKIIEYLMNNYVLWAWDVTYESNEKKLNEWCKNIFSTKSNEKQFYGNSVEQLPLLIGISRDTNCDYSFTRLIEGSNKKLNVDEFLAHLIGFKDKFDLCEKQLEKAKEDAKKQMLINLFQARDIHRRTKHRNTHEFLRSVSMMPHLDDDDDDLNIRRMKFSRLLSGDIGMKQNSQDVFSPAFLSREEIQNAFEQFHIDAPDDDADDEDDEPTPVPDRPIPKFP